MSAEEEALDEAPKKKKSRKRKRAKARKPATARPGRGGAAKFPRHTIQRALRIPKAIIEQNAGKECSEGEAAQYVGVGLGGPFRVEISSAIKYGLLSRPRPGYLAVTERARQAVRPQKPGDEIEAMRQAVLEAPEIADVYKHYRGEDLPDGAFFTNALVDKFKIPNDKVPEFVSVFVDSLESARLIEKRGDKLRILDVTSFEDLEPTIGEKRTSGTGPKLAVGDSCFVVMPFAGAIGGYFHDVYEPAIKKAGLKAVRADADIFGTGKIIDQIWSGINAAKVLVAELTTKNPNVFYELGLAHALNKPVVLVSSNEEDVPFDLRHIRVIYYDVTDPFWGQKLIEKVAENIVSAIKNPEEAVFKRALDSK
jgi:hypothetical protein